MKAGEKIKIPSFRYHVTYYKPSSKGNLTHEVYDTPDEAYCKMKEHTIVGYQIFNFSAETLKQDTEFTICD